MGRRISLLRLGTITDHFRTSRISPGKKYHFQNRIPDHFRGLSPPGNGRVAREGGSAVGSLAIFFLRTTGQRGPGEAGVVAQGTGWGEGELFMHRYSPPHGEKKKLISSCSSTTKMTRRACLQALCSICAWRSRHLPPLSRRRWSSSSVDKSFGDKKYHSIATASLGLIVCAAGILGRDAMVQGEVPSEDCISGRRSHPYGRFAC